MADIRIEQVRKEFGASTALENITLHVADGEFLALLGPSGCGKTTLLRIVAGLEVQTAGRVFIGGRDVSDLQPRQRGLAMVFQNYAVFPHMKVRDNVAFGLTMAGADTPRIKRQVERTAALLHIEAYLDRYPAQLSGGQRQRVAVARALAVEPGVLLMDEPLSNLDALLRLEMRAELKSVLQNAGTTTIYVTHDQTEAMGLADRIAVLHSGRIEQIAEPDTVYRHPATRYVGGFVGSPPMNFLRVPSVDGTVQFGHMSVPAPVTSGDVVMGIRAEDIDEAADGLAFTVRVVEPLGVHTLLTGTVDGQLLRVTAPPDARPRPGQVMYLRPRSACITWLDTETGRALEPT